jgi:hypothetical protein
MIRLSLFRSFDRIKKKKPFIVKGFNLNLADRTGPDSDAMATLLTKEFLTTIQK